MLPGETKKPKSSSASVAAPASPVPAAAPAPEAEEDEDEWDLNNASHCVEILAELFPHSDLVKCGITIPQFSKIAAFYIESLKKRVPKATLAQHFDDITSSRKKRLDWLTCWGKQRISQFMAKPAQK